MKRITAVLKQLKVLAEDILKIREKKIFRAVESGQDYLEEKILDCQHKELSLLEDLGKQEDMDGLEKVINDYIQNTETLEQCKNKQKYLKQLKDKLNETVEVEQTEE